MMSSHTAGWGALEDQSIREITLRKKIKEKEKYEFLNNLEKMAGLQVAWLCFVQDFTRKQGILGRQSTVSP